MARVEASSLASLEDYHQRDFLRLELATTGVLKHYHDFITTKGHSTTKELKHHPPKGFTVTKGHPTTTGFTATNELTTTPGFLTAACTHTSSQHLFPHVQRF